MILGVCDDKGVCILYIYTGENGAYYWAKMAAEIAA